jgi:maltooligosyltrehalose trehalohydrolase
MKEIDVSKRTIGINFNERNEAEIRVWSPTAEQLSLVCDDGEIELRKEGLGYWYAQSNKLKPGTQYKFLFNGKDQYPDPASLSQPDGVHERSEAIDLKELHWNDEQWNNLPLEEYIIYELHTGTFTEQGTFAATEEKLDHLISVCFLLLRKILMVV